jgi:hypothetical protein
MQHLRIEYLDQVDGAGGASNEQIIRFVRKS